MTYLRNLFWLCVLLVPISFIGLQVFFYITQPNKDSFYVGTALAQTGIVYAIDLIMLFVAALCVAILMFVDKQNRTKWLFTGVITFILIIVFFLFFGWVSEKILPIQSLL